MKVIIFIISFCKIVNFHLRKILINPIKKYIDYWYLTCYGVETELGFVTLRGFPIISKHPKARIILGEGTILISKSKYNHAGINHPVILAAETENALIKIDGVGVSGSSIVAMTEIIIERGSGLGANATIYDTDFHPIGWDKNTTILTKPVHIQRNAWIGANCLILKGVIVGENSIIGAGSVVIKSVESNCIYAGNPAKFIRKI